MKNVIMYCIVVPVFIRFIVINKIYNLSEEKKITEKTKTSVIVFSVILRTIRARKFFLMELKFVTLGKDWRCGWPTPTGIRQNGEVM